MRVVYPNLVLTPPAAINNAAIGEDYSRTFVVENGGLTSTKQVIITLDYGSAAYFQGQGVATLEVDPGTGFTTLTPTTTVGGKVTYVLEGANLGASNELLNGGSITLRDNFKLKTCNLTTVYTAGWGCDVASPCQEVDGTSVITMEAGAPNFSTLTFERSNITSLCQDFTIKLRYENIGTFPAGSTGKAAGMYDVIVKLINGGGSTTGPDLQAHTLSEFKIGGTPIPGFQGDVKQFDIPFGGMFNTDPDGPGVGLDDLDGDGFYDDLPAGETLELEVTVALKQDPACEENINDYSIYAIIKYKEACDAQSNDPADIKTVQKRQSAGANPFYYYRKNLVGAAYAPANVYDGVQFDGRISAGFYYLHSAYRTTASRFVYEVVLPAGFTMNNIQWHTGKYPAGLNTPVAPQSVTQNGNTLTVVSPDQNFGYFTFKGTATCANPNPAVNYTLHEVADYANHPDCKAVGANIVCDALNVKVIDCPEPCAAGPSLGMPIVERDDNFLGWTDASMTTRQTRDNISVFDLAKSMYKDEFKVETTATQHGPAANLGMHLVLAKAGDRGYPWWS